MNLTAETETTEHTAARWTQTITLAEDALKGFRDAGREVSKRYKAEQEAKRAARRFNVLYSNTEVLQAALYGRDPKPDVRRNFNEKNPVAREVGEALERALIYTQNQGGDGKVYEAGVKDYLLPGRAIVRVEYEPEFTDQPIADPMTGQPLMDEEGQPITQKVITDQKCRLKYVFWEDFIHPDCRTWEQVGWLAFRHTMDKDEVTSLLDNAPPGAQSNMTVDKVPFDWAPQMGQDERRIPEEMKKAEVWEVWHKADRKRIWHVKGAPDVLRIDDDPYGLENFYPCAEPLISYSTNDSIIPDPEYFAYKDQAADLDEITGRISRLTRALKRRGVYNKAMVELKRLATAGDNDFIPVENYSELAAKGGLQAQFQAEDITMIAVVLKELYVQRQQLIDAIYEITGISDILRGASDPNETLGAQQIKSQFGSLRLKRRQRAVQVWIKNTLRIKAELIAEHYEPNVLSRMTGIQVTPEMVQIMREDRLRGYAVNIETDSTIFEDAQAEQQKRVEMLTAVAGYMQQAIPAVMQVPQLGPLVFDMLGFGVRSFKAGRELEDKIEEFRQQMTEGQINPPNQNDGKQKEAEGKLAIEKQKADGQLQIAQQKAQGDLAIKQQKVQADAEAKMMQQQGDPNVMQALAVLSQQVQALAMAMANR